MHANVTGSIKANPLNETNNDAVLVEDVRYGGVILPQYATAKSTMYAIHYII